MLLSAVHLLLHLAVPALVARIGFARYWLRAWLIMLATMIVDIDHLLADPIYAPDRCSIGFHPLHSHMAIAGYLVLTAHPKTRLIGLGLMIHMLLDGLDCARMSL